MIGGFLKRLACTILHCGALLGWFANLALVFIGIFNLSGSSGLKSTISWSLCATWLRKASCTPEFVTGHWPTQKQRMKLSFPRIPLRKSFYWIVSTPIKLGYKSLSPILGLYHCCTRAPVGKLRVSKENFKVVMEVELPRYQWSWESFFLFVSTTFKLRYKSL